MVFKKGETPKGAIPFKKGQSGNPKGRPRKLVRNVIDELKKEGIEPVNMQDIKDIYLSLVNTDSKKLNELAKGENTAILVKTIAKAIMSGKGFDIIEKMFDRAIGKAMQPLEQNIKTEDITPALKNKKLLKDLGI